MPSNPRHPDPNNPPSRAETPAEFSRRVQDSMDYDSWCGQDKVGARYPTPARIVDIDNSELPNVIYKRRDGE